MKKRERESKILELLRTDKSVTVSRLSELTEVSAVTIRTDLKELEESGALFRTHGGAVVSERRHLDVRQGFEALSPDKLSIAQCAEDRIRSVQAEKWIFLGSGSTCLALAHRLSASSVNVVTNNLAAAEALCARSSPAQLLMPGGSVSGTQFPFLYGDMLQTSLGSMTLDYSFVGVSGIDRDFGYSLSNAVECSIFSKLRLISKELIVLADLTKFGKTTFMRAGPLSDADCIITSGDPGADCRSWCSFSGVELVCAPPQL